nr:MAG TPA: hypothetical protein [Caudoviricetes sp.]
MSRGGGIPGCIFDLLDFCAMKNLFKLNRRDWIDLACWLMVSILVGLLALPVMVGRRFTSTSTISWRDLNGKILSGIRLSSSLAV